MEKETRFRVGGIEFVSGLEWVTLDASGRERPLMLGSLVIGGPGSASRKELSHIEGASSAIWRTTEDGVTQLGVSTGKPGSISLAAFVANVLAHEGINTFVAAFRIDESSYALVGAVDGLVQMTVELCGDEEEVRKRAQEELSVSDPGILIIAPEGFGIGETRHDAIEDLIDRAEKSDFQSARLIRISPDYGKIGFGALFIALIAGGSAGGWYWYKQKQAQEQMRIAQEMLRQQQSGVQPAQAVEPEIDIVPVSQAINACYQAFLKADLYPGGWKNTSARCVPGDLALQFDRNGSRIVFLRKTYPDAVVSLNGQTAEVHIPVEIEHLKLKARDLGSIDQMTERLNDVVLSFRFSVNLMKQVAPQPVALPGRESQQPQQPQKTWSTVEWNMQGLSIGVVPKDFDFKGMSFKEMTISSEMSNGVAVKGELYGN